MTSLVLSARRYIRDRKIRHIEARYESLRLAQWWVYRCEIVWLHLLGFVFLFAPNDWFGPTWSHIKYALYGGSGIGVSCLILAAGLTAAVWIRSRWLISAVLLLAATLFWVGAFLIAAQGISGHTGMIETPLMMYVSVDLLIRSGMARR